MTSLLLVACHAATAIDSKIIEITVKHPSQGDEVLNKQLFVHLDTDGHIHSYSMEVDSVICLDVQCEVIPVRLYFQLIKIVRVGQTKADSNRRAC